MTYRIFIVRNKHTFVIESYECQTMVELKFIVNLVCLVYSLIIWERNID